MRAVIQRVSQSNVQVNNKIVGEINEGLMVLLGVSLEDTLEDAKFLAEKIVNLRIFEDEQGKMNLSVKDVKGKILSISQFTLYGDCRKGRRPSFVEAAKPDQAEKLYEEFNKYIKNLGVDLETGTFQADMKVFLINDGPVTFILDSKKNF